MCAHALFGAKSTAQEKGISDKRRDQAEFFNAIERQRSIPTELRSSQKGGKRADKAESARDVRCRR
jgi:hypothetical protein